MGSKQRAPGRDRELDAYMAEVRKRPLLDAAEEAELARRVQAHAELRDTAHAEAEAAKERLEECNLRLVIWVAKHYRHRGLPLPDLIEEGNIGLLHAAGRFDPAEGVRFSTYAVWWIKQAIRRALSNKSRTVRVPAYMAEEVARWRAQGQALERRLGRPATDAEMLAAMKPTAGRARMLLRLWRGGAGSTVPLDLLFEGAVGAQGRAAEGERPDLLEFPAWEQPALRKHIERLPTRQAELVRLRYGMLGEPLSLRDAGARLGLSHEGARKLEQRALAALRALLEAPAPGRAAGPARRAGAPPSRRVP